MPFIAGGITRLHQAELFSAAKPLRRWRSRGRFLLFQNAGRPMVPFFLLFLLVIPTLTFDISKAGMRVSLLGALTICHHQSS